MTFISAGAPGLTSRRWVAAGYGAATGVLLRVGGHQRLTNTGWPPLEWIGAALFVAALAVFVLALVAMARTLGEDERAKHALTDAGWVCVGLVGSAIALVWL